MTSLSICIICQDEEEVLPYTLYGIQQTLLIPHLREIVIVDGGSQDNTLGVIEEWKSKLPIVLLEHPYDGGGNQKNRGMDLCTGDYILVLDADMTFTKNLGPLFAAGAFNDKPVWDFRLHYTVVDEFHCFEFEDIGATTRLSRSEYRYTRPWHEQLPMTPPRTVCPDVRFFENSHLQTRKALLHRAVRWLPWADQEIRWGPTHGGDNRFVAAEARGRADAKLFPPEVRKLIVPRDGLEVLRELDERRRREAEIPPSQEVMENRDSLDGSRDAR